MRQLLIDEIITYIAQDNPSAERKMLDSFFMDMLVDHPQVGHARLDLNLTIFLFTKITNPIEIVRVLSTYRDIANLLF